jgi:hypothetical protein
MFLSEKDVCVDDVVLMENFRWATMEKCQDLK